MFNQFPYLDPNKTYNVNSLFEDIINNKLIVPKITKRSEELIDLCVRMLNKDKDKRISWEELFKYPFIN
jgi:serine/threonine protein kinase